MWHRARMLAEIRRFHETPSGSHPNDFRAHFRFVHLLAVHASPASGESTQY
jgi:hypothetical protein